MTTIIADVRDQAHPCLWADTLAHSCDVVYQATKIHRISDSLLFGGSGGGNDVARFAQYLRSLDFLDLLEKPGNTKVFEISDEKDRNAFLGCIIYRLNKISCVYQMYEDMIPAKMSRPYHAVGSGSHFALGALMQGATPWEALHIAAQLSTNTRAPFELINFEESAVQMHEDTRNTGV